MGNDIRSLQPNDLSILTNPAVLAISQDPLGSLAFRRWRYYVPETDRYGEGEISMWSGDLNGGDAIAIPAQRWQHSSSDERHARGHLP